jgi:AraC family transcriptional regulator, transcriptional activator FtrA
MASNLIDVVLLAYQGVDELDLFGAWSVLRKAADIDPGGSLPAVHVALAAPERLVTGSGGLMFRAERTLDDAVPGRALVVPGGRGAAAAARNAPILSYVGEAIKGGCRVYGVCTGSLIIAATGHARARALAIHRNKREMLLDLPVNEVATGLVEDGPFVTVGGDPAHSVKSVDLAFALLADFAPHAVEDVGSRMELMPGRRPTRSGPLAPGASLAS